MTADWREVTVTLPDDVAEKVAAQVKALNALPTYAAFGITLTAENVVLAAVSQALESLGQHQVSSAPQQVPTPGVRVAPAVAPASFVVPELPEPAEVQSAAAVDDLETIIQAIEDKVVDQGMDPGQRDSLMAPYMQLGKPVDLVSWPADKAIPADLRGAFDYYEATTLSKVPRGRGYRPYEMRLRVGDESSTAIIDAVVFWSNRLCDQAGVKPADGFAQESIGASPRTGNGVWHVKKIVA